MRLIEYFDPKNPKHLEWFNICGSTGSWPEETIKDFEAHGVEIDVLAFNGMQIMAKIANSYMKQVLGDGFICPPAFKNMGI